MVALKLYASVRSLRSCNRSRIGRSSIFASCFVQMEASSPLRGISRSVYPSSPPHSNRSSSDSDADSLRKLEFEEGPEPLLRHSRARSVSTPVFQFHHEDLLPLSLSESDDRRTDGPAEKNVGVIKGA